MTHNAGPPPDLPAQSGLNANRHLLAAIIQSCEDAIVSKTLDGIITSWNPAAERIFGYTAQEAIGCPISIIVPPDRGFEEPKILERIRHGEKLEHFETFRMRKDGKRISVSLTISPIRDEQGTIIGASKIARDITEARLALEQLRLERERLQVTLKSIGDAVIVTDPAGVVQFLNPVAEALTGWGQTEAEGQPLEAVFRIINEVSRRKIESPAVKAIAEGRPVPLANHTLLLAKNGTELAIDDSAAPIRDLNGEVSGVVLVFRDVSAHRAIDNVRARLSAIVESSDDAIIGKDFEGRIISWNQGAERMFGYASQEVLGRPVTLLIPPERLAEETEILRRIRAGDRIEHFETLRMTKRRKLLDVSLTISPILNAEGKVVGASKIARDITEKKRAEKELQAAHERLQQHAQELEVQVTGRTAELRASLEELETFSSSLSHDLKAPLRFICGQAGVLEEDYGAQMPHEARDGLYRIGKAAARLGRFIDNVLSYSRLRAQGLDLTPVDLNQLVPRVLEEYPHASEANAEVEVRKPFLPVQAHEALLTQAVANLISNGVKFVTPGTRPNLKIWTERAGEKVRINIQDNGIGISEEERKSVFNLFSRASNAKPYEGSGIGLAVVQRAIKRMGGDVGVSSQPGRGSTFWIELRRSAE